MRHAGTGALSVALGMATQASRFVLLLFLARVFDPADVGRFGLATATVGYAQYFLGADFYTFTIRELPARGPEHWPRLLRTHLAHAARTYALVLPALLAVFAVGILRWEDLPWFYVVLTLDHLGQELYRLLTALERPLHANFTFFLRSGAWAYVVIAVMAAAPSTRVLTTVWMGWTVGCAIGLVAAAAGLRDRIDWGAVLRGRPDAEWLRQGTWMGLAFLPGTLSLRGITVFDRYLLQYFTGPQAVGVYSLFSSIGSGIQLFVNYGTTMILFPRLVAAHAQGRREEFDHLLRRMLLAVSATSAVLAVAAGLVLVPILDRLASPLYRESVAVLWIWLLQAFLMSVALVPNYALFARRQDRPIRVANVAGLAVSLLVDVWSIPRYGALGAALGPLAASVALGTISFAALHRKP